MQKIRASKHITHRFLRELRLFFKSKDYAYIRFFLLICYEWSKIGKTNIYIRETCSVIAPHRCQHHDFFN